MRQGITHKEAVRQAKERLGEATAEVMAAYIQESFGLAIKPVFVTVLLGSLQERALLERSGKAAYEKIERWKADNPQEAKKAAAAVKRREAARQRVAAAKGAAGEQPATAQGAADLTTTPAGQGAHQPQQARQANAGSDRLGRATPACQSHDCPPGLCTSRELTGRAFDDRALVTAPDRGEP